ncbi:MAG: hypothetical protein HY512_03345 [Candidatus Aenigmarchaeota archaeon]|nr:hypothetical protein [Candidatus Aenigmarchaeota archaeon]
MAIHVVYRDGQVREIRKDREFGKPAETYFIKGDGTYIHVKTSGEGEVVAKKRIDSLRAGLTKDLLMGASPEYVRRNYGHRENITFEILDRVGSNFPTGTPVYQNRETGKVVNVESDKTEQEYRRVLRARLKAQEVGEEVEAVA